MMLDQFRKRPATDKLNTAITRCHVQEKVKPCMLEFVFTDSQPPKKILNPISEYIFLVLLVTDLSQNIEKEKNKQVNYDYMLFRTEEYDSSQTYILYSCGSCWN